MTAKAKAEPAIIEADGEISSLIAKRVTHTTTGLIFDGATSYEEWEKIYGFYSVLKDRTSWLLGDCLRHGESYGERYAQAVEITQKSYSHLTTLVYVCSRFSDLERRHEDLPFSWHESVAALAPQTADTILAEAKRKNWSRDDVRDAAAKAKGLPTKAQKAAAKEAKANGGVKHLPPAANPDLPIIDIQTTTTPIERYVWNGFPITVRDGKLIAGEALPDEEAERCAHHFKFPSAKVMMMNFAESPAPAAPAQPPSPPEPAPVTPQPTETPAPPAAAQGPKPTEIEPDQNLALQMCEANLNRFNESIKAVDWSLVLPLARKRWLRLLIDSDNLIDLLQAPMKQA